MRNSNVMTVKERKNGELEKQLAIKDSLLTLRVLSKFNKFKTIEEKIVKEQANLNMLWDSENKYNRSLDGKE